MSLLRLQVDITVGFIGYFSRLSLSVCVFWAADWLSPFFFLVWACDLTWLTNQYMPLSVRGSVRGLAGVHACVDFLYMCVWERRRHKERARAIWNWVEQWGATVSLSSRLLYPHSRQLVHRMNFTTALKATQTNVGFLQQRTVYMWILQHITWILILKWSTKSLLVLILYCLHGNAFFLQKSTWKLDCIQRDLV